MNSEFKLETNKERFLDSFRARARQLADEVVADDVSPAFASLELIAAIYSANRGGVLPKEMLEFFPVRSWREELVGVPVAMLRPIVEGWTKYRAEHAALPLGVVLGVEGGGQGKIPAAQKQKTKDQSRRLANLAVQDYIGSRLDGQKISWDAACLGVAEREGVSAELVQKARKKHWRNAVETLKALGYELREDGT